MFNLLPPEILGEVFCRLSSEQTLSNVAMVCREWSEIASEKNTQDAVRKRFLEEHKRSCTLCCDPSWTPTSSRHLRGGPFDRSRSAMKGTCLDCLLYRNYSVEDLYYRSTVNGVLRMAIQNCHYDIIRYLARKMGHGVFTSHSSDPADIPILFEAARHTDTAMLRFLVEQMGLRRLCGETDGSGETVVHAAARFSHIESLKYLVGERGLCDILSVPTATGETVLSIVVARGNLALLRYLIDECGVHDVAGACCTRDKDGVPPLHRLVRQSFYMKDMLNVLRYLKDKGLADACAQRDKSGNSVLHAVFGGQTIHNDRLMKLLQFFIGDMGLVNLCYATNDLGETILFRAIRLCRPQEVFRYLVCDKGLRDLCFRTDLKGNTILHAAAASNASLSCYDSFLPFLVRELGLRDLCFKTNHQGETLLHVAARVGYSEVWCFRVGTRLGLSLPAYKRLKKCVDCTGKTARDVAKEREYDEGSDYGCGGYCDSGYLS